MKKRVLLHAELSQVIASMGHGDALVIADAGLPVPAGTRCIDLAVTQGVPSFESVLAAVLDELQVERAEHAIEASTALTAMLRRQLGDAPLHAVEHVRFKQLSAQARAIVRTGEFTPYANVILYSGVVF